MDFGPIVQTISDMGALGVSAIVIWALVTERLIPKGRLDDKQKDLEAGTTDAQMARERADKERERADKERLRSDAERTRADHVADVMERATETMKEALRQLRRP